MPDDTTASPETVDLSGGFVLILRRVWDDPDFRDAIEASIFVKMICVAAHRPVTVRVRQFDLDLRRGQIAFSLRDWAADFGITKDRLARLIARLERTGKIRKENKTVTATVPPVLTICNYDKYQLQPGDGATVGATVPYNDNKGSITSSSLRSDDVRGRAPVDQPEPEFALNGQEQDPVLWMRQRWNDMANALQHLDFKPARSQRPGRKTNNRAMSLWRRIGQKRGYYEAVLKIVYENPAIVREDAPGRPIDFAWFVDPDHFDMIAKGEFTIRGGPHGSERDCPPRYRKNSVHDRFSAAVAGSVAGFGRSE